MKRLSLIAILLSASVFQSAAQTPKGVKYHYTDATELTIVGKLFPDTANPYHRIDTDEYTGFNDKEISRLHESSGLAVAFKTNSTAITVKAEYLNVRDISGGTEISEYGFDLYIRKGNRWIFVESHANTAKNKEIPHSIIKNMDDSEKECLIYLPVYSELKSVKIGVVAGSEIAPLPEPFRHRICVFGSSFTQGCCVSRPGMIWTSPRARQTGLGMLNIGLGGNSRLQPAFADAFSKANMDALVIDAFSNPTTAEMKKRLFPFIRKIQKSHPEIPIIFLKTIYRENRNFNVVTDGIEARKMEVADSLMNIACTEFKNVYYIAPNATCEYHDTSTDGIHPSDFGYRLWVDSIKKPLLKILKNYDIE